MSPGPHALPARVRLGAATLLAAFVAGSACCLPAAHASDDQGASWSFAPALAPPPPEGAQPSLFPTAVGQVGDIEFWSPNRGLLITGGNRLVPAGLYAYDGVSWHELSTVCGGAEGRIAWAGPDEFWTISDQRPGQLAPESGASLEAVSLCHFKDGSVVGSYALPLSQPESYRKMDAAACDGPADCWFGGKLGQPPNTGAFHLHWDGSQLAVLYSPQDHAVASMALDAGQILESVQLGPSDSYGEESEASPTLLHDLVFESPEQFQSVFPTDTQNASCGSECPPLPEYGRDASGRPVAPDTLGGLAMSSDWSLSGAGPASPQLWAVAGRDGTEPPAGQGVAHAIALRYAAGAWTQIVPDLATFGAGEEPLTVAADPGETAAWIATASSDGAAHVELLSSTDGGATWSVSARDQLGPEQQAGARGTAGPIACPAPHECWLATSQGWLFHLTDGTQLEPDSDPFFDGSAGVIAYRPPDGGVPQEISDQPPPEGSQAIAPLVGAQEPASAPGTGTVSEPAAPASAPSLLSRIRPHVIAHDVLRVTFVLSGSAHVQLVALRRGRTVARSRRMTLRKGRHALELQLSAHSWPTKLELRASPAR